MDKITNGARLRAERDDRGWSRPELARRMREAADERTRQALPDVANLTDMIKAWEAGKHAQTARYRSLWVAAFADSRVTPDDEIEALDLVRRVEASDVGDATLTGLESAFDDLAVDYQRTPPAELLDRLRVRLGYVSQLIDARKSLTQHRRLLVTGGWLSLLAATCHIDLNQRGAASARLRTAAELAKHTGHHEIAAWVLETEAWQNLTDGDYPRAVALSQAAQRLAPSGSSAEVQATAQEGRAWSRLGDVSQTHALLDRVAYLSENLPPLDRAAEHHYRYDAAKGTAYRATVLAWVGDPEAEPYAREVVGRMLSPEHGPPRLRRAASARLDLSLALVAAGEPDEAAREAITSVTSGVLVPSNYWRAAEVVEAVEARKVPEARELAEAYREFCGPQASTLPELG